MDWVEPNGLNWTGFTKVDLRDQSGPNGQDQRDQSGPYGTKGPNGLKCT